MSYDKMDSSAVYAMFEEIKSKLNKKPEQPAPATPAVEIENIGELREAISKLNEAADKNREPQEYIHKHHIELMSNKVLIVLAVAMTVIVVLAWIVSNQRKTIGQFRDNDIKYRYIEMRGTATLEDMLMLRETFDFNRNSDSIAVIRKRVEKYEQLIKEGAEQQARARANAQQAEELKQKAENIKNQ